MTSTYRRSEHEKRVRAEWYRRHKLVPGWLEKRREGARAWRKRKAIERAEVEVYSLLVPMRELGE